MDIKYDKIADAVYMKLFGGKVSKTLEINENLHVDLDEKGQTIGIEVLDASNRKEFVENLQKNVENGVPISISESTPAVA